jgi:hypothetical protein
LPTISYEDRLRGIPDALPNARPPVEEVQPGIEAALEELVGPESRGDPQSPLRWTTKSVVNLVKGLYAKGFQVGRTTVARLLKQAEAVLDPGAYSSGVKVTDKQVKAIPLTRQQFHGEWNYTIRCGPIPEA